MTFFGLIVKLLQTKENATQKRLWYIKTVVEQNENVSTVTLFRSFLYTEPDGKAGENKIIE